MRQEADLTNSDLTFGLALCVGIAFASLFLGKLIVPQFFTLSWLWVFAPIWSCALLIGIVIVASWVAEVFE